jgi:hypothetical protein
MTEQRAVTAPQLPPLTLLQQHPFAEEVERLWVRIAHAYFSTVESVLVSPSRRRAYDQVGSVYAPLFEWLIQRSLSAIEPGEWAYLRQRIEHLLAEFCIERSHAGGFDASGPSRRVAIPRSLLRRGRPTDR